MLSITLLALIMVGVNITFSYLELKPFLAANREICDNIGYKISRVPTPFIRGLVFIAIYIPCILCKTHLLLPSLIDIFGMIAMTSLFSFGAGLGGGIAALFASNLLSFIIYWHTHIKVRKAISV
jgi:hypothetical protein